MSAHEAWTIERLLRETGSGDAPDFVRTFAHAPCPAVVFGAGSVERLGGYAKALGGNQVLVVTDRGLAEAGHLEKIRHILTHSGLAVSTFTDVIENPTTETVEAVVEAARTAGSDLLVGLGGGSSMDAAKGANFILSNGGKMQDYWGVGKATKPMLPFIAIPTTAGTGSECQSFALISDALTHIKMACGDKTAAARVAILDPALTLTQPPMVTRHTGIDALTHALESVVSTKSNPISKAHSRAAFGLLADSYVTVLSEPDNLRARSAMLLGAALAGTAIENSMLGAAHATANPLTAKFNVVHGEAVGIMMPYVLHWNAADKATMEEYDLLAKMKNLRGSDLPVWFTELLTLSSIPTQLPAHGVRPGDLPQLAAHAVEQWTGSFNPRHMSEADFLALYEMAMP